jgi:hypothetical protein
VGGGLASIGLGLCPSPSVSRLWWVPLIADFGCVPGFAHAGLVAIWVILRRRWRQP